MLSPKVAPCFLTIFSFPSPFWAPHTKKKTKKNQGLPYLAVVDDLRSRDPWRVRCLEIRGIAEVVPEQELIRIHPQRVISFGIDDAESDPHEMTVHARDVG